MFIATRAGVMAIKESPGFTLTIASDTATPNIPQLAAAAGWNGTGALVVNITAAFINTLRIPAEWIFPGGLTIIVSASTRIGGLMNSGTAIVARVPVTINNSGTISGGGGMGGTGRSAWARSSTGQTALGGGGAGGNGQGFANAAATAPTAAGTGTAGTYQEVSGVGGVGSIGAWARGADGGPGGAWGAPGASGGVNTSVGGADMVASDTASSPAGPGGPAGLYLDGSDFVTWGATGTRQGGVGTGRFRYYRIHFDSIATALTYVGIYEIELRATAGGADITTPATPTTAKLTYLTNTPDLVVDNNISTFWAAEWPASGGIWLQCDIATSQLVRQVAITPRTSAGTAAPSAFRVLGSNDGAAFIELANFTGLTGWSDSQQRLFSV